MSIEMLPLNNGSSESKPVVVATMMSIEALWEEGLVGMCTVSDLYERCRNPNHKIAQTEEQKLKSLALLQSDGRIHDSIKNIVLSAITGESFDIQMASPVKQ